jgi:hypothetical protein
MSEEERAKAEADANSIFAIQAVQELACTLWKRGDLNTQKYAMAIVVHDALLKAVGCPREEDRPF